MREKLLGKANWSRISHDDGGNVDVGGARRGVHARARLRVGLRRVVATLAGCKRQRTGDGHPEEAHRVLFDKEFLDHYGKSMADRIPSLLDEWRLTDHLEVSHTRLVVVSSYGVRLTAG